MKNIYLDSEIPREVLKKLIDLKKTMDLGKTMRLAEEGAGI
jgi:hypothetical protein